MVNKNNDLQFNSRIFIAGSLITLTGLHIGGNSTEMSIGGADKIVIRDPLTNYPYIPGSSLRGKMRSLIEKNTGYMNVKVNYKTGESRYFKHVSELSGVRFEDMQKNGIQAGPSNTMDSDSPANLFGAAIDSKNEQVFLIPQRLIVRDAKLHSSSAIQLEKAKNTDMPMTEVKTEVAIDRVTSQANPRQIERVPAGARFEFEFILNLYGDDDESVYLNLLFQCMQLLQDDYLGGHGSRGYGRIRFDVTQITRKDAEDYRKNQPARPLDIPVPDDLRFTEAQSA